jgi:hypothetical protein
VVADHEGSVVLAQERVDLLGEPALVAELETVPPGRGQLERHRQPLQRVLLAPEGGGELPHHRSELVGLDQRHDPLVEAMDALFYLPQAAHVSDVPAGLDGEQEAVGRFRYPARYGVARGQPVEGRVDLDRVELLRVGGQPARGG